MYIKAQTVIPTNIKITKCPPKAAAGKNFFAVLRMQERALEKQQKKAADADRFVKLIKAGCTAEEAIKIIKIY